jgi:hypothetical protein
MSAPGATLRALARPATPATPPTDEGDAWHELPDGARRCWHGTLLAWHAGGMGRWRRFIVQRPQISFDLGQQGVRCPPGSHLQIDPRDRWLASADSLARLLPVGQRFLIGISC